MNFSDVIKTGFRVFHTSIALIFLLIIGLFVYEKNVINFTDYIDIYAVIPSKSEFEGDEPITFFLLSENKKKVNINLEQILMCDYGDGNGFGFVSSQESVVELGGHNQTLTANAREFIDFEDFTGQNNINRLKDLMEKGDISDFIIFGGGIPSQTSQCIMRFNFSKNTPNFNLKKTDSETSYPFDYVWYYSPASSRNFEDD